VKPALRNPGVSIGIPTYNRADVVGRAIESVLAQQYEPLELIVVDDGSTDATRSVLARYEADGRIRVVTHRENRGVGAAKNSVLDAMSGEYGGILDSDDELLPGAIDACVRAFGEHGQTICQVFGNCVDAGTSELTGHGMSGPGFVRFEDALRGRFRGEYWQLFQLTDLGGRRFHPEALGAEGLVWHAMLREKPGYYIGQPVRRYDRGRGDRVSIRRPDARTTHGRMMVYKVYLDAFEDDLRRIAPGRYAELAHELAKWQARTGRRLLAAATLADAFRTAPTRSAFRAAAVVLLPRAISDALTVLFTRGTES
jgi:glycosyltransferase involved in cell wall biosynthesis